MKTFNFLNLLLERELNDTLIELHHTKDRQYSEIVKAREAELEKILAALKIA